MLSEKNKLYQELFERYQATGRIGFIKPKTKEEAIKLIETVICVSNEELQPKQEVVISVHDLTNKLRTFLESINDI